MAWWGWLLVAWVALACVAAVWISLALWHAERREWARHGRVDRRRRPPESTAGRLA